jgi:hypothetical protein
MLRKVTVRLNGIALLNAIETASPSSRISLTGTWTGTIDHPENPPARCSITITGMMAGTIVGDEVTLTLSVPTGAIDRTGFERILCAPCSPEPSH